MSSSLYTTAAADGGISGLVLNVNTVSMVTTNQIAALIPYMTPRLSLSLLSAFCRWTSIDVRPGPSINPEYDRLTATAIINTRFESSNHFTATRDEASTRDGNAIAHKARPI